MSIIDSPVSLLFESYPSSFFEKYVVFQYRFTINVSGVKREKVIKREREREKEAEYTHVLFRAGGNGTNHR